MSLFTLNEPPEGDELRALDAEAERLAIATNSGHVGVEHFFLAFRSLPDEHEVWRVLRALPVNLDALFAAVEVEARSVGVVPSKPGAKLPRTPRVHLIHKLARSLARRQTAPQANALHLLCAVSEEGGSVPARQLRDALRGAQPRLAAEQLLAYSIAQRLLGPHVN